MAEVLAVTGRAVCPSFSSSSPFREPPGVLVWPQEWEQQCTICSFSQGWERTCASEGQQGDCLEEWRTRTTSPLLVASLVCVEYTVKGVKILDLIWRRKISYEIFFSQLLLWLLHQPLVVKKFCLSRLSLTDIWLEEAGYVILGSLAGDSLGWPLFFFSCGVFSSCLRCHRRCPAWVCPAELFVWCEDSGGGLMWFWDRPHTPHLGAKFK